MGHMALMTSLQIFLYGHDIRHYKLKTNKKILGSVIVTLASILSISLCNLILRQSLGYDRVTGY